MPTEPTASDSVPPKTITLYQYMSWENAEKVFTDWALKATLPHHTNDPFELMPAQGCHKMFDVFQEKNTHNCFLCFSHDLYSAALWGHYANSHHDVCLEFEFPIEYVRNNHILIRYAGKGYVLLKVQYEKERFFYDPNQETLPWEFLSELFEIYARKDPSWSFEKEYRICERILNASYVRQGMVFFRHPMQCLTKVFVGVRAPWTIFYLRKIIEQSLVNCPFFTLINEIDYPSIKEDRRIVLTQMKCHDTEFKVVPSDISTDILLLNKDNA